MTYALPWRYSTTELKGPVSFYSLKNHYEFSEYKYIELEPIYRYIFYLHNGLFPNYKFDLQQFYLPSAYRANKKGF